jgi:general stress protein 26
MTNSNVKDSDSIKKIRELIKDIEYAMLTTVDKEGKLHSRPMATNGEVEFDGDVWFFTYANSLKVDEVQRHHEVNVSYAAPNKQSYVSLSGTAELIRDRNKLEELWQPQLKAWFPKELNEPDIALIKVSVEKAEYWDSPSSIVANTIAMVKAVATGETAKVGEHEKVQLK